MAIYHLEAKVVSRGKGRSAVAASAYLSCSRMYNDYDGIQHDYTRKHGLVYQEVMLPALAPTEWANREVLWNAVEETEKTKDSRLAREFVTALPVELNREQQIRLLREFIQENFVQEGMCADFAIHDTNGHNPHAHILLTVRPLDEQGHWQYKTEKEYLCIRGEEEKSFTAAEYKTAQQEGWEKQYQYFVGKKKKAYMTPSAAQEQGLTRASKHPKSTKFGRQNPITERWNSEEQLVIWRAGWANYTNRVLEQNGIAERIDHRSFAECGLLEQPTIHEGVVARNMEKQGLIADRCEINRQIKADNKLLRELKKYVDQLVKAMKESIPSIAETLEGIRERMIILQYHLFHNLSQSHSLFGIVDETAPIMREYQTVKKELQSKKAEKKSVSAEKKNTSLLNPLKHIRLSQQLTTLTEEIEELTSHKNQLMFEIGCHNESDITAAASNLKKMGEMLEQLKQQKITLEAELSTETDRFYEAKAKVSPQQEDELLDARLPFREASTQRIRSKLQSVFGQKFDWQNLQKASQTVDRRLNEDSDVFRERILQKHWEQERQQRAQHRNQPKRKRGSWER